jgi:ABC-type multidrug transport system fused ATPase/permease subunit
MISNTASRLLLNLFLSNRWSILLTYTLTFLENLFELLYPLVIGFAIDGLLKSSYMNLMPLFCTWFANFITAISRHLYDTRIFTRIYSDLATMFIVEQSKQKSAMGQARAPRIAQIAARSTLSREFVDFFEHNVPQIITTLFGFVGALAMLFFYDGQIGLYCLALLIPLLVINLIYARKSRRLNENLNDQLEREVEIIATCHPETVRSHYTLLAKWRVRLSNAEAVNYGLMELFTIALVATILFRTMAIPGIQAGEIYAIVSYLWNFLTSLDDVPVLVQQFTRLQDIGDRMQLSTDIVSEL